jgi:hypothetical protein
VAHLSDNTRPGRGVRKLQAQRTNRALWFGVASILLALTALVVVWFSPIAVFFAAPLSLLSIFLGNRLNQQSRLVYVARQGAQAEEYVGRALEENLPGWQIFHNVPFAGLGDADHLAVGPAGIILVETKSQRGTLVVSRGRVGFRQPLGTRWSHKDFVQQTRQLTEALKQKNLPVTAFLCFPYAEVDPLKLKGVQLVDLKTLLQTIQQMPVLLTDEEITTFTAQLQSY